MKNWQVQINQEGNLFIQGLQPKSNVIDLFGNRDSEHGICIYSYYLRPLRQLLSRIFPNAGITSIEAIESIIKEEFCDSRSISIFKSLLDKADIPYRTYSNVA